MTRRPVDYAGHVDRFDHKLTRAAKLSALKTSKTHSRASDEHQRDTGHPKMVAEISFAMDARRSYTTFGVPCWNRQAAEKITKEGR